MIISIFSTLSTFFFFKKVLINTVYNYIHSFNSSVALRLTVWGGKVGSNSDPTEGDLSEDTSQPLGEGHPCTISLGSGLFAAPITERKADWQAVLFLLEIFYCVLHLFRWLFSGKQISWASLSALGLLKHRQIWLKNLNKETVKNTWH